MKKINLFLLMFSAILLLASCAPAAATVVNTSAAVQIPDPLKLAISGLLLAVVMAGLQVVFETLGLDLRGFGTALAAAISTFVIAQLQGYINVIDPSYDTLVKTILDVLVVVLGGLGYLRIATNAPRAEQLLATKHSKLR